MVCLLKIDMKSRVFVTISYSNYCSRKPNLKIVLDPINSIYWFYSLKKKIKTYEGHDIIQNLISYKFIV